MDDSLIAAYRSTDYRVRLSRGGTVSIRIDQPLPATLLELAGERPWGFITAWNPGSRPQSRAENRSAQRELLRCVRGLACDCVVAGVGVGSRGWRENSLFVVGPTMESLDVLARHFGQLGYVHGQGAAAAQLRVIDAAGTP